jgi:Zn-dependent membrane protease YugP
MTQAADDKLIAGLKPRWRHILLEENLIRMTGREVARTILRDQGRTDVQVCVHEDGKDCYSPFLNLIGLSQNVAGSCSVMAVATAAHEVGHALQLGFIEKISEILKGSNMFSLLASLGELFVLLPGLVWCVKSAGREKSSTHSYQISQSQQNPKQYSFIHLQHLIFKSVIALLKSILILLVFPINFLIYVVFIAFFGILFSIAISCALISRWVIFLIEIHASCRALSLLKQYNMLDRSQQKAAKIYLRACALTYLRSFAD